MSLNEIALGIVIGVLFVSLLVLFCIVLVKLYINKIKTYTKVIYQKDLDFQKSLNTTIIETQEQVLNNISQDLHDDAGQQLTYINFQIENLKLDSPELGQMLMPLTDSVGRLSQSIRRISHSLNNQLLMQQDLIKAVASEADRLKQNGKISVKLNISESKRIFEQNEQIVLYRIFQEAINNILKHSKADAIEIEIKTEPIFIMKIADNGKGFVNSDHKGRQSIGLQNMRQRAAVINYTVEISSEQDKGTVVTVAQNH